MTPLLLSALAMASELDQWRARAALAAGERDQALMFAGAALRDAPEDVEAHLIWQEVLLALDARWWLEAEYRELAQGQGTEALIARWWLGEPLPRGGVEADRLEARRLLDTGREAEALELLDPSDPLMAAWRLEALEGGALRREANDLFKAHPEQLDDLAPVFEDEALVLRPLSRSVLREAERALGSEDPLPIYRAHALLVAAGERDLALQASERLTALGEPFPLANHAPWSPRLTRDVGKMLAVRSEPVLPEGSPPHEAQRAYAWAARELMKKGRSEDAAALWRRLLQEEDLPAPLRLEAALALEASGEDPAELVTQARRVRADMALHGGPDRDLARAWYLEARALRSLGRNEDALIAADTAVALGADATCLVLQGELLELAGQPVPAFRAYAEAASLGVRGLEPRLDRLYVGPASPQAVVDAWPEEEVHRRPPPKRETLFPAMVIETSAGSLDTRAQWTLLFFWASWCRPCGEELPEAAALTDTWAELGIRVVAVSADDTPEQAARFVNRTGLDMEWAWSPELASEAGVQSLPTVVLVSPDGRVHLRRTGYAPGDMATLVEKVRLAPVE